MKRSAILVLASSLALAACGGGNVESTTTTIGQWTAETLDSVVAYCAEVSPSQADSCAEFVAAIQADGCSVEDTMMILDERAAGNLVNAVRNIWHNCPGYTSDN